MKLRDKVVVVTGAGSGIGRAAALLLAREGARVALVDTDETGLSDAAQAIEASGGAGLPIVSDVADAAAVDAATARVLEAWSRLDGLVTAAGISVGKILTETTLEDWERVFAVNVKGTFLWLRAVLPGLVARGGGSVVTVASQLAVAGGRASAAYIASKGAVISLTRSVALDYAQSGVRANVILPGAVETPMLERSFRRASDPAAARETSRQRHPIGRFGKPEEIAQAALFLISDDSAFVTGAQLPVDGGWLAG